MKKNLFKVTILTLGTLMSCQKGPVTKPAMENQNLDSQTELTKVVHQKNYQLKSQEILTQITKFKSTSNQNISIPLDSAQWILEASLNYDFDSGENQKGVFIKESISIPFHISQSNVIKSEDLKLIYKDLQTQISQNIQTKKLLVSAVDIYATVKSDNSIIIKADLFATKSDISNKISTITNTAFWCTSDGMFNNVCGTSSLPDASVQVEAELDLNNSHGSRSCYWTNVTSILFYGWTYSSALYYYTTTSQSFCNDASLTLSASQQNTYVSNAYTLANNNKPINAPDFMDFDIQPYYIPPVGGGSPYQFVWHMNVTYGDLICP